MKVLVACEYSGKVRDAFLRRGHDAWSCDLLPTTSSNSDRHIQGDVRRILRQSWDLVIAHPPCTFLTNAGVRHLYSIPTRNGVLAKIHGEARWEAMREAAAFFNLFKGCAPKVCIENPVPHRYARELIGGYSQIIQPWQFGHKQMKATCLWLEGLNPLVPTDIVGPPPKGEARKAWQMVHRASPGPDRWKLRSTIFDGIADAMGEQWGIELY